VLSVDTSTVALPIPTHDQQWANPIAAITKDARFTPHLPTQRKSRSDILPTFLNILYRNIAAEEPKLKMVSALPFVIRLGCLRRFATVSSRFGFEELDGENWDTQ
jgi:hypothetical protein